MNRSKQLLIRIYLYIFKNTFSNGKILDKNIKNAILKKQKNLQKAEFFCSKQKRWQVCL
jgi:hypothetical protein